ncbi:uncharacterized protein LOC129877713 [Solanum dulcamara]|uniref:uncharacterized protein LOC129877713 n=1 Tax=Solanum dulcamara TaxID=45834 RepID=UPI00248571AC|nr:uncharacterized protein LOC129877713 [Solanum dulcamara]
MALLRVNPSVHLGRLDKIETTERRSIVSMVKMNHVGVVSASSLSLSSIPRPCDRVAKIDDNKHKDKVILSRNLDDWMNVSIVEIVKNLNEAPLLVHVYANEDTERIKTERALPENWPIMKNEWESGKTTTPDGLIFVEELREGDEEENNGNRILLQEDSDEVLTKSWGVIVQGKGIKQFVPACYLLKTSRVKAGRGMDLFCTHFCLVRVKNFSESALKQFKSCWL